MATLKGTDNLFEAARKAQEKAVSALQEYLPPGSAVAVKSGPEHIGRFTVLEYPRFSGMHVLIKNSETGVERRVSYQQLVLLDN